MDLCDDQTLKEDNSDDNEDYFCAHYHRKCKFVTPCCNGVYRCRFCHDEEQDHALKREDVTVVECCKCGERQGVTEFCQKCNLKFGKYFCYECKLYDDEDKQQFHCQGCGICRVGGRDNYFHCHRCDMCLPNHLQGAHKCVEKVSRSNCPVCQEDIHTSRIPSQIPPCNHLIHKNCFDEMLSNGHYACPVCGVSMINMNEIWKIYDQDIEDTPMPEDYYNLYAHIQCRDCSQSSLSIFHILGIKCVECGSYNTVREKGPLVRKQDGVLSSHNIDLEDSDGDGLDQSEVGQQGTEQISDDLLDSTALPAADRSGSLTPPETPNRGEMDIPRVLATGLQRDIPSINDSIGSNQDLLTPEPSPVRETSPSLRTPVNSAAVRRITFSDDFAEEMESSEDMLLQPAPTASSNNS